MGNKEVDNQNKTPKTSSTQEQPPLTSPPKVYPDWTSFQAYYNPAGNSPMPPPGFFPSVASSPQGHPYMWGPQIIPPYGTPPPYVTMYPGALYPHPSFPLGSNPYSPCAMPTPNGTVEASAAETCGAELDGKGNETGKVAGVSANGLSAQSGDSGSEDSSEGSSANSENGGQLKQDQEQCSGDAAEECQKGSISESTSNGITQPIPASPILTHSMPLRATPQGGIGVPATTLNIGMDYWGSPAAVTGKFPGMPSTAVMVPSSITSSHDGLPSEPWLQDERELKRQKRKQSNRESARRSRLRKQAECDELAQRVETLKDQNDSLRQEVGRTSADCDKLAVENAHLSEIIKKHTGGDANATDDKVNEQRGS